MKKIPLRTCVLTKEKLPKKELIRIVKFNEQVSVDTTGKANGKGCYLKKDKAVIEKAKEKKLLNKVLDIEVPDNIYEELLKTLD